MEADMTTVFLYTCTYTVNQIHVQYMSIKSDSNYLSSTVSIV